MQLSAKPDWRTMRVTGQGVDGVLLRDGGRNGLRCDHGLWEGTYVKEVNAPGRSQRDVWVFQAEGETGSSRGKRGSRSMVH